MAVSILKYWQDGQIGAFQTLFDSAPILMQASDPKGILYNVSNFWAEKLGFARDEMIGQRATRFLTDASRRQAEDHDLPALRKTGRIYNVEYDFVRKNGDILPVQQSTAAYLSPEGEHVSSLAVMFDNSDVKRRNAEFSHNQRMEALGQLVGGVAHDFNNILTVIRGNAEFIRDDPDPRMTPEYLRDILNAADRAAGLTQMLLHYGQKSRLRPVPSDLNQKIRELEVMLKRVIPNKVDISIVTPDDLWPVQLDPHSFETALINLVNNARDAMPKGGKLTIETCNVVIAEGFAAKRDETIVPGDYVMLSVSDTGDGIQPEITDHIFEPYFTTKPVGSGTGLGLSMVIGFVKQSGGMIRFATEEGFGTTFKLYFPKIIEPALLEPKQNASYASRAEPKPKPMADVLLIEDEHDVRRVLAAQIESGGYSVAQAPSGDAALALLQTGYRPRLLVTDIIMPGDLQGPELVTRARELLGEVKVILVSGMPVEAQLYRDEIQPFDILLRKPFESTKLMQEITELLGDPIDHED